VQEKVLGKPGDAARVVAGPFEGTEGVIRGFKPDVRKVVLEISFLGTRVEVDIDEAVLRRP
jgi:transcription antitermination factor NusG